MDRRDRLFRFYRCNPTTEAVTSLRPRGIMLFGFKEKLKWTIFINFYAISHILLTSGTTSCLLLLPQAHLKNGHPLTQTTNHPLPTLSPPTSPLSAPPHSAPTILHHPLYLFFIPHLPSPCIHQLLNDARMPLLPSNQTALLGQTNYFLLPLLLTM